MPTLIDEHAAIRVAAAAAVSSAGLTAVRKRIASLSITASREGAITSDRLLHMLSRCDIPELGHIHAKDNAQFAQDIGVLARDASEYHRAPQRAAEISPELADCINQTLHVAVVSLLLRSLWILHEQLVSNLLPIDSHIAYWRERADWRFAYGSIAARAFDLLEGGPIEWALASYAVARSASRSIARHLWTPEYIRDLFSKRGPLPTTTAFASEASSSEVPLMQTIQGAASGGRSAASLVTLEQRVGPLLTPSEKIFALSQVQDGLRSLLGAVQLHLAGFASCKSPADHLRACRLASEFLQAALCQNSAVGQDLPSTVDMEALPASDWVPGLASIAEHAALQSNQALTTALSAQLVPLHARSLMRQRWLRWTVLAFTVFGGAAFVTTRRKEISRWAIDTSHSLATFWTEHLAGPLQEMAGDISRVLAIYL